MRINPVGVSLLVRWELDMLCVISGGNWNNGSNAGVWSLNANNVRGNSNSNIGFRADSMPGKPNAANAARQRGSNRRGWCRNQNAAGPLVADPRHAAGHAKTGLQPFGGTA
jgi:hypothetical protein